MDSEIIVWVLILVGMSCLTTLGGCLLVKSAWLSAGKTLTPTADLQQVTRSPSPERSNEVNFRVALESFLENCQRTLPLSTLLTVTYRDGSNKVYSFGTSYLPVLEVCRALMTGGSITLSQERSSEEYSPMGAAVSLPSLGLLPEGMRVSPEKTTPTSQPLWFSTRRREGI